MKSLVLAGLLLTTPVQAKCHHFSIWSYPWPQRCPIYKSVQSVQETRFLHSLNETVVHDLNWRFVNTVPLGTKNDLLLSRAGRLICGC